MTILKSPWFLPPVRLPTQEIGLNEGTPDPWIKRG